MKRKRNSLIMLLKMLPFSIIGLIIIVLCVVCLETDHIAVLAAIIPVIIPVAIFLILCCVLFNKLNKIIALLQDIAKQNGGSGKLTDSKNETEDD